MKTFIESFQYIFGVDAGVIFVKTLGEANCFGPKKIIIYFGRPPGLSQILIPKLPEKKTKFPTSKMSLHVFPQTNTAVKVGVLTCSL